MNYGVNFLIYQIEYLKKVKKYIFSNMIRTDGISVYILFIIVDVNGKPLSKTYQNKKYCQEENINYIKKDIM